MNQKGFANIIVIIGIVILAGVAGYFVVNRQTPLPEPTPLPIPSPLPSPTPAPTTPKAGDIEEIQTLLKKNVWVRVIVVLKGNEFTAPEFQDDVKKKTEVKKIQDAVLVTLTENDFQISHQYQFITSFAGMVSNSGMEKLLKNSQVVSISMDRLSAPN